MDLLDAGETFTGFVIPVDYDEPVDLQLGRPATRGEACAYTSGTYLPGEPLSCLEVHGTRPTRSAGSSSRTSPSDQPFVDSAPQSGFTVATIGASPYAGFLANDALALSATEVLLLVTADGESPFVTPQSADRGACRVTAPPAEARPARGPPRRRQHHRARLRRRTARLLPDGARAPRAGRRGRPCRRPAPPTPGRRAGDGSSCRCPVSRRSTPSSPVEKRRRSGTRPRRSRRTGLDERGHRHGARLVIDRANAIPRLPRRLGTGPALRGRRVPEQGHRPPPAPVESTVADVTNLLPRSGHRTARSLAGMAAAAGYGRATGADDTTPAACVACASAPWLTPRRPLRSGGGDRRGSRRRPPPGRG